MEAGARVYKVTNCMEQIPINALWLDISNELYIQTYIHRTVLLRTIATISNGCNANLHEDITL